MGKNKGLMKCQHLGCDYSPKTKRTRDLIKHEEKPHLCDDSLGCTLEHTKPQTNFKCDECRQSFSSKERVETHQLKKHKPKPIITPANDLAAANEILNNILSDAQKKRLMDAFDGFEFDKIREMVEKFKLNKNLRPILDPKNPKIAYGCWIDPIEEAIGMLVQYLKDNPDISSSTAPVIFKLAFDAARVSSNGHYIVTATIEIIDGNKSIIQIKSPYNNKPFLVFHGKETYDEFRTKLAPVINRINGIIINILKLVVVIIKKINTHLKMVNDYACNIICKGLCEVYGFHSFWRCLWCYCNLENLETVGVENMERLFKLRCNTDKPELLSDAALLEPDYGEINDPLFKFQEKDLLGCFLHIVLGTSKQMLTSTVIYSSDGNIRKLNELKEEKKLIIKQKTSNITKKEEEKDKIKLLYSNIEDMKENFMIMCDTRIDDKKDDIEKRNNKKTNTNININTDTEKEIQKKNKKQVYIKEDDVIGDSEIDDGEIGGDGEIKNDNRVEDAIENLFNSYIISYTECANKLMDEMKNNDILYTTSRIKLCIKEVTNKYEQFKKKVVKYEEDEIKIKKIKEDIIKQNERLEEVESQIDELKIKIKDAGPKGEVNVIKDKFVEVIKQMSISVYKSGKSKTIDKVLEKMNYKYSDVVKIINGRSKILGVLCDDSNRDDYIKLWNLFAYMINSLQSDDITITLNEWLIVGDEFHCLYKKLFSDAQWTSYLHAFTSHCGEWCESTSLSLIRFANFGTECRHKFIKGAVDDSNHLFNNLCFYENTFVTCYNWGDDKDNQYTDFLDHHDWCKNDVEAPPEIFIGGKKMTSFFKLKEINNNNNCNNNNNNENEDENGSNGKSVKLKLKIKKTKFGKRGPYKKKHKNSEIDKDLKNLTTNSIYEKTLSRVNGIIDKYKYTNANNKIFEVTNERDDIYSVYIDESKIKCTCKAYTVNHVYHGKYCKHILYILIKHYKSGGKELEKHWLNKTIPGQSKFEPVKEESMVPIKKRSYTKKQKSEDSNNNNNVVGCTKTPYVNLDDEDGAEDCVNIKKSYKERSDWEDDREILDGIGWLSNFIINMYVYGVLNHQKNGIYFAPYVEEHHSYSIDFKRKTLNEIKKQETKTILIPVLKMVNDGNNKLIGNHWILYAIDKVETNMFNNTYNIDEYDSLINGTKKHVLFRNKLVRYFSDELGWSVDKINIKDNFESQKNSYDCGVYVCMFAKYIAERKTISRVHIKSESVSKFRSEIKASLIEYGFDK